MFYNIWISGSQYADNGKYDFVFEKKIKLKEGLNHISLCSATVGLAVSMIFIVKVITITIFYNIFLLFIKS